MKKIIPFIFFTVLLGLALGAQANAEAHGVSGPDLTFLYKCINFILLLGVLIYFLGKPAIEHFRTRAATIKMSVEEAGGAHQTALAQAEEVSARLRRVDQETREMLKAFKEEGELQSEKIIKHAQEFSEKLKADAIKLSESEVKRAREELKVASIALAQGVARDLISKEITSSDEERLALHYLQSLKEKGAP